MPPPAACVTSAPTTPAARSDRLPALLTTPTPGDKPRCGALDQPPGHRSGPLPGRLRRTRLIQAPDLIEPPTASQPAQVLLLACAALTAGDLEAAVALYEADAVLSWGADRAAVGQAAIRGVLAEAMNMRLPLRGRADNVLLAGNLALITGERSMRGTGP